MQTHYSHFRSIFAAAAFSFSWLQVSTAWSQESLQKDVADESPSPLIIESITVVTSRDAADRVAGSADFLSAADLEEFDYGDINRVLRRLPGVNIQDEDGFGLRPNIGLRATGLDRSSKITLMEDGVLIAPAPYSAPSAYYFPHAARISAVEVVKGPGAIKYGPFTTGGAINLFSTPVPETTGGQIDALFGSDSFTQIHARGGSRVAVSDTLEIGVSGEALKWNSDGFKVLDGGGNTGFDIDDYVGKIELVSSHVEGVKQSLQIKAQYSNEISNETYLGLTENDFAETPFRRYRGSQRDQMDADHRGYQVTYKASFTEGPSVTVVAYRNEFERDWFKLAKVFDPAAGNVSLSKLLEQPTAFPGAFDTISGEQGFVSGDNALSVKHNSRSYVSEGIQAAVVTPFKISGISHKITGSFRYHEDRMNRFQWADSFRMDNGTMVQTSAGIPGTDSNRIDSAKAWSGYVNDEIAMGRWTLTPGVRIESIDFQRLDYGKKDPERTGNSLKTKRNSVSAVMPGIGVSYRISDPALVFAGVHRGFTPPGAGSAAKEETSVNYEAGVRYLESGLYAEGIGFFTNYQNLIGTCTNSSGGGCLIGDQFDAGKVNTYGLEATLGLDLASSTENKWSVPLDITYTFTRARFQTGFKSGFGPWGSVVEGDSLPYIPRHQTTISLGVVDAQWSLRASLNYVSKTRSQAGQGPISAAEAVDSRAVVDLAGEIALTENADLVFRAENVFDTVYSVSRRPAGLRPGLPFLAKVGIKLRL